MGSLDDKQTSQHRWIAHLLTRALRAAGATEITPDADGVTMRFRAADGSPITANLARLYEDCVGASADDRAAHIDRFVAALSVTAEVPTDWERAAALLRPVLRPAGYAQGMENGPPLLARPFQPLLNEMVVIDQPGLMSYVSEERLRDWGVAESVVFDRARANLAAVAVAPELERQDQPSILRFAESGDEYWASHLLVDGWLATLASGVGGRPVAFLPDATELVVATDEPALIGQLLATNEQQYLEAARPLSPQAYTVDDAGRVVPYAVAAGDELWSAVRRSAVLFASREYGAQKEEHDDELLQSFIASLKVGQAPDGGVYSVAVWGRGVDTLLPEADYVAFASQELEPFMVPWEVTARETGLAPEPGWSPVRYRVRAWPDLPTIERLRAAGVSLG